jgi:hypothetical protein
VSTSAAANHPEIPDSSTRCREDHALAKRSRAEFEARMKVIGEQSLEGERLLLGNCKQCHTTLAINLTEDAK